ncbi:DUF6939 family protein [Bacillus cereus]|uniref:DUF6939 family protein n=1 Tax=Bacillus cereus TaxID=1396 RepID=UPI000952CF73|nr:hypothetical protein [Bacillus cereus]OLR26821.1 hypothetical protein BLD50_04930 [Bacillus cereus]
MTKIFNLHNTMAMDRVTGEKLLMDNNGNLFVDSADVAPEAMDKYRVLNPFNYHAEPIYPVPKMKDTYSHSIESIWQGLKIIENKTDVSLFNKKPCKRPNMLEREKIDFCYEGTKFLYGNQIINHLEARFLIYCPIYLYNLEKICSIELINTIGQAMNQKQIIVFYDWDDNFHIENLSSPFSHSAILAAWFNGSLEKIILHKAKACLAPSLYEEFSTVYSQNTKRYTKFHNRGRCLE